MVTDMRLDETIAVAEVGLEPINVTPLLLRIAQMGAKLEVHECFISLLGVADIELTRLPNSMKLGIYWNEGGTDPIELHIVETGDNVTRQQGIYNALQRYLAPSLNE